MLSRPSAPELRRGHAATISLFWLSLLAAAITAQQFSIPEGSGDDPMVPPSSTTINGPCINGICGSVQSAGSGAAYESCALSALQASETGGPQVSVALSSCYWSVAATALGGGGQTFTIQTQTEPASFSSITTSPTLLQSSISPSSTSIAPAAASSANSARSRAKPISHLQHFGPNQQSRWTQMVHRIGVIQLLVATLLLAAGTVWFMDELLEMLI
ncbi:hypothetical protein K437DRAFT_253688 [Tilletiaria anomala UBC 951]|uniref:Uncharacterized protein n=1 Tax=Tilletiaria anomala (strain ATCC 24038 / CBS 436.72 / UBC 951) TaxID=1037660 RepID=A0A066WKD5_TILAU|nr:uncharacterized protein K437DRAFT_253688 [Tilletiaria anomala UBC 951]KDN53033.1 hypothetical protein K437DRAFT_253688 [Tilletiaria anomala UBC 951]